jgi:regulator of cell morphogenesis and NO signaling
MISKMQEPQQQVSSDALFELILKRYDFDKADLNGQLSVLKESGSLDMHFLTDLLIAFESPAEFSPEKLQNYPIQLIINYLRATHKYYINQRLPEIEQTIEHLDNKCQGNNASLKVLKHFFSDYKQALLEHIESEERELYPHVINLSFCFAEKRYAASMLKKSAGFSLETFMVDHDHEHEMKLNEIVAFLSRKKDILQDHLSFRVLKTQFDTFMKDLHVHEMLEEEVLVPMAKLLEKELKMASSN